MDISHQQILPYNYSWPEMYAKEAELLRPIFGDALVGIEHIGSTSIPGLSSKPIIDIAVLIRTHSEADSFIEPLMKLGYVFNEELHAKTQFPERHFFRKGEPTQFHLSIAYADKARFWPRQILFRDHLRTHPEDRDEYARLKEKLIKEDPTGSDIYIGGKTELILSILKKAGFE